MWLHLHRGLWRYNQAGGRSKCCCMVVNFCSLSAYEVDQGLSFIPSTVTVYNIKLHLRHFRVWGLREFDIHMSVHRKYNSTLQPRRCNVSWYIYFYRHSTCFRRFLRPSSGAHNCTYSLRYCQPIMLLAAVVDEMELRSISSCRASVEINTGWHKKTGTFEKPNKNWRNPMKKIYWQKLNHYNLKGKL